MYSYNSCTYFCVICALVRLYLYVPYVQIIGVVNEWFIHDACNKWHQNCGLGSCGCLVDHVFAYFHICGWMLCSLLFIFSQCHVDALYLLTLSRDVWLQSAFLYTHLIIQVCNIQPHTWKNTNIWFLQPHWILGENIQHNNSTNSIWDTIVYIVMYWHFNNLH
jgi:hypothetical protein